MVFWLADALSAPYCHVAHCMQRKVQQVLGWVGNMMMMMMRCWVAFVEGGRMLRMLCPVLSGQHLSCQHPVNSDVCARSMALYIELSGCHSVHINVHLEECLP
jgi:hypothetical protein